MYQRKMDDKDEVIIKLWKAEPYVTVDEIAKAVSLARLTVYRRARKLKLPYRLERRSIYIPKHILKRYLSRGKTMKELCKIFNCSYATIYARRKKYNV